MDHQPATVQREVDVTPLILQWWGGSQLATVQPRAQIWY